MHITDPAKIAQCTESQLMEGHLPNKLGMLSHALEFAAKAPDDSVLTLAVRYIQTRVGISLSCVQFSRLLELYPFVNAKLADYGWGDSEVEQLVLDVLANAFLGSRWPVAGLEHCDVEAFSARLRFAAKHAIPRLAAPARTNV